MSTVEGAAPPAPFLLAPVFSFFFYVGWAFGASVRGHIMPYSAGRRVIFRDFRGKRAPCCLTHLMFLYRSNLFSQFGSGCFLFYFFLFFLS